MAYSYDKGEDLIYLAAVANNWADLATEYRDPSVREEVKKLADQLRAGIERLKALPGDPALRAEEPDDLEGILALAPRHRERTADRLPADYDARLKGAVWGRCAGCILGAAVEGYEIDYMKAWAQAHNDAFPPTDYWSAVPGKPGTLHYTKNKGEDYLRQNLKSCPVDDDINYMLLGLLILEEYGFAFTTDDVGRAWKQYLPMAYTAEEAALNALKRGVDGMHAAEGENPFVQLIGADIRADAWGYVCPGNPGQAAEFAYRDAYLSHRRNGIYGEMYFAAVIAAAFTAKNPFEALYEGLNYIPEHCWLAESLRWALEYRHNILDYEGARAAVDQKFAGMPIAHTVNNACLTIFALHIAGEDFTRLISQCVAMGMDNDCTTATAASIFGAVYGIKNVPGRWYIPFGNRIESYLNGVDCFEASDLFARFRRQAELLLEIL